MIPSLSSRSSRCIIWGIITVESSGKLAAMASATQPPLMAGGAPPFESHCTILASKSSLSVSNLAGAQAKRARNQPETLFQAHCEIAAHGVLRLVAPVPPHRAV